MEINDTHLKVQAYTLEFRLLYFNKVRVLYLHTSLKKLKNLP
jgi:hypothetical protein